MEEFKVGGLFEPLKNNVSKNEDGTLTYNTGSKEYILDAGHVRPSDSNNPNLIQGTKVTNSINNDIANLTYAYFIHKGLSPQDINNNKTKLKSSDFREFRICNTEDYGDKESIVLDSKLSAEVKLAEHLKQYPESVQQKLDSNIEFYTQEEAYHKNEIRNIENYIQYSIQNSIDESEETKANIAKVLSSSRQALSICQGELARLHTEKINQRNPRQSNKISNPEELPIYQKQKQFAEDKLEHLNKAPVQSESKNKDQKTPNIDFKETFDLKHTIQQHRDGNYTYKTHSVKYNLTEIASSQNVAPEKAMAANVVYASLLDAGVSVENIKNIKIPNVLVNNIQKVIENPEIGKEQANIDLKEYTSKKKAEFQSQESGSKLNDLKESIDDKGRYQNETTTTKGNTRETRIDFGDKNRSGTATTKQTANDKSRLSEATYTTNAQKDDGTNVQKSGTHVIKEEISSDGRKRSSSSTKTTSTTTTQISGAPSNDLFDQLMKSTKGVTPSTSSKDPSDLYNKASDLLAKYKNKFGDENINETRTVRETSSTSSNSTSFTDKMKNDRQNDQGNSGKHNR